MKRPDAILHMFFWGLLSGTVLALLYPLFFMGLNSPSSAELLLVLTDANAWVLAFGFGAFPGAILGLLTGVALLGLSISFAEPFTVEEMKANRFRVYMVIGTLAFVSSFLMLSLVFKGLGLSLILLVALLVYIVGSNAKSIGRRLERSHLEMSAQPYITSLGLILLTVILFLDLFSLGFFLPPILAGIVSAYAAHRYMFRLRLWSEAISLKEKAKNFGHLEDKAKNEEIDFENEAQSQSREK